MLPETSVLKYVGRAESASPATGSHKLHEEEERELIARALEFPHTASETDGVKLKATEVKVAAPAGVPTAK